MPRPGDILANMKIKNTKSVYNNFFDTLTVSIATIDKYNTKFKK